MNRFTILMHDSEKDLSWTVGEFFELAEAQNVAKIVNKSPSVHATVVPWLRQGEALMPTGYAIALPKQDNIITAMDRRINELKEQHS